MAKTIRKRGQRFLAGFLSAAMLLCSCVPSSPGTASSGNAQESGGYETYKAADLAVQKNFDAFTDRLFRDSLSKSSLDLHFTLADPKAYGITDVPDTFGEFSLEEMKHSFNELRENRKELQSFKMSKLTPEQKLTHQLLEYQLETELSMEGMELYLEPVTTTIGLQAQLPILLSEYRFYTREDVDHYLALVSDIDRYYSQLLEFEKQKSTAGLFMSDKALDHVIESCQGYLIQADHSFLADTFNTRIDALTDLSEEEKAAYKEQNIAVLAQHFVPAYELLTDGLNQLRGTGRNDKGLFYYPQGKEYFEYLVASNTGTSYKTVDKLLNAMEKQLNADLTGMAKIASEHPDVFDALESASAAPKDPGAILETLQEQIKADFPELPQCTYSVKYVPEALQSTLSPAFYLVPALDRFSENVIYINPKYADGELFSTLAHEGYPGHLYQSVYFINSGACSLRHNLSFPSYAEGWATYVEQYSYGFDNGMEANASRFMGYNGTVSLGLYALLDVYINYLGWDREKAGEYLKQFYNVEDSSVTDSIYDALVENPTNYMEYYVGYMEIANMRDIAEKTLKDNYNAKNFHSFILDMGPSPFTIIQRQFTSWLRDEKAMGNR